MDFAAIFNGKAGRGCVRRLKTGAMTRARPNRDPIKTVWRIKKMKRWRSRLQQGAIE